MRPDVGLLRSLCRNPRDVIALTGHATQNPTTPQWVDRHRAIGGPSGRLCTTADTATHSYSPTPTPSPAPTPSPTASPAPVSDPPLALLYNNSPAPGAQQLEAINAKGVEQWGLTQAQEGQYFGLTAQQYGAASNGPQIGGSNLFFFFQSTPTSVYQVAVVSQNGTFIGTGTAPALNPYPDGTGPFQVSPTRTEWAWTTDETPNASGQHHGVVEVGGLGEVNRIVYRWIA